jgi:hypothetical protein
MTSSIAKFRIVEKNNIHAEISSLEKNIERCEKANGVLNSGVIKDINYIKKTKDENDSKILLSQGKIVELNMKLASLASGELDSKIVEEVSLNTAKVSKKIEEEKKKSLSDKKVKKENKERNQVEYKINKESDYSFKQKGYDMCRAYERFLSVEPPPYIQDNLKKMPNNKGYIFRGVWFFGDMPLGGYQPKYPIVMFESRQGVKLVHEIYANEHLVFRKTDDNRKILETKTIRNFVKK